MSDCGKVELHGFRLIQKHLFDSGTSREQSALFFWHQDDLIYCNNIDSNMYKLTIDIEYKQAKCRLPIGTS